MPTFERTRRFRREYLALSREQREAFKRALGVFIGATRSHPPAFPRSLRVKGVQGHPGVYEMSFGDGGRATFEYGEELRPGEAHVVWRRIGDHSIFRSP
ncbi:MAG: hypothetical protein M3433_03180 [Actinomycetota bacterium]|nr:hypothetical protein [Actinomycetota bacterium]